MILANSPWPSRISSRWLFRESRSSWAWDEARVLTPISSWVCSRNTSQMPLMSPATPSEASFRIAACSFKASAWRMHWTSALSVIMVEASRSIVACCSIERTALPAHSSAFSAS